MKNKGIILIMCTSLVFSACNTSDSIDNTKNIKVPENLKEYSKTPDEDSYNKLNKVEKAIADNFEEMDLDENGELIEGQSSLERDMKLEAKSNLYKSLSLYAKKQDKSMEDVVSGEGYTEIYGDNGFGSYRIKDGEYVGMYYDNSFKELGDLRIESIWIDPYFEVVNLNIRNNSNDLIKMKDVYKNLTIVADGKKSINGTDGGYKDKEVEDYLGVGLVKNYLKYFRPSIVEGDIMNNEDNYESIPEEIKLKISYKGKDATYNLKKSQGGNSTEFNEEAALKESN